MGQRSTRGNPEKQGAHLQALAVRKLLVAGDVRAVPHADPLQDVYRLQEIRINEGFEAAGRLHHREQLVAAGGRVNLPSHSWVQGHGAEVQKQAFLSHQRSPRTPAC